MVCNYPSRLSLFTSFKKDDYVSFSITILYHQLFFISYEILNICQLNIFQIDLFMYKYSPNMLYVTFTHTKYVICNNFPSNLLAVNFKIICHQTLHKIAEHLSSHLIMFMCVIQCVHIPNAFLNIVSIFTTDAWVFKDFD